MFDRLVTNLLQGGFVCETTDPEGFRWLQREDSFREVDAFLSRINRGLTTTINGQAFYARWRKIGQDERSEVKKVFAHVKQVIRPLMHFISLCMEVQKKDAIPRLVTPSNTPFS